MPHVQGCIKNRAGCEDDGVVVFAQVGEGRHSDVAEETDVAAVQDPAAVMMPLMRGSGATP